MPAIGIVMQHYKIHGGIEGCVYSLTSALNERGIEPLVIGRLNHPGEAGTMRQEIAARFGRTMDFQFMPLWVDRFRKTRILERASRDSSIYLPIQLRLLNLDMVYDFTLPFPLRVPRGHYVKYWSYAPDALTIGGDGSRRMAGPLLDSLRLRALRRGYPIYVNSQFSSGRSAPVLGIQLPVLYPPVSIQRFWTERSSSRRGIVALGRFAPYKRQLELVRLASQMVENRHEEPFVIMGGNESFPEYARQVLREAELVRGVRVIFNPPLDEVIKVMQSSALYVHPMIEEPFGITTAEAMAAGCVPLVHDSGGQREIVPWPELRWNTFDQLEAKVRELVNNADELDHWRALCQNHVSRFDERNFQRELTAFLDVGKGRAS